MNVNAAMGRLRLGPFTWLFAPSLLFIACASRSSAVGVGAAPNSNAPHAASASAAGAPPAPAGTEKRSLAEWRKLARDSTKRKDWKGAAQALSKAVILAPNDATVFAELGYAQLKSGDLKSAAASNSEALQLDDGPEFQAQVLYNQAQVAKLLGRLPEARTLLEASLKLREHPSVAALLASIPETAVLCADNAALLTRCQCLVTESVTVPWMLVQDSALCSTLAEANGGRLAVVNAGPWQSSTVLLVDLKGGSRVLARLGALSNPGAGGYSEDIAVSAIDERSIAGKTVFEVHWEHRSADHDAAGADGTSQAVRSTTLCVLDGASLTCPQAFVTRDESDSWGSYAKRPPLERGPTKVNETATYTIAADGTLTITRRVRKAGTERRKLW